MRKKEAMKRKLKFRAWTTHNGWSDGLMVTQELDNEEDGYLNMNTESVFYVSEIVREQGGDIVHNNEWVEDKNIVIMQFTGKYDKYNKDIYEGDVLLVDKSHQTFGGITKAKVEYVEQSARFHLIGTTYDNLEEAISDNSGKNCSTIIGNIYENPKLLHN